MDLSEEFQETDREAWREEVCLRRDRSLSERLAEYLDHCEEAARLAGTPPPALRRLLDRDKERYLERLDQIVHGP